MEEYMLQIHEAVAVICHMYPDQISDQGKNLTQDWFYHGLSPSLCDALRFAMAELPEKEQVNMSYQKDEVPLQPHRGGSGPFDAYRDKYRRCSMPVGWVSTLEDEELFLPDPETRDPELPEFDLTEGLSVRMTQAMNHFQWTECRCFVCGMMDHFARDCPHCETFHAWHKEHLNSKGAGQQKKAPALTSPPQK